jgi:hypothetical protein
MPYGRLVIIVCAISAGIHAALTPEHLGEGVGAGGGFLVATVMLAGLALALTRRTSLATALAAAVTLAGLLASYALAVTTGVPVLHPDVEAVDALAIATKAIEAAGLLAALAVARRHTTLNPVEPKGTLT